YVRTAITGDDGAQSSVALTGQGRAALDRYIAALAQLPRQAATPPAPGLRAGDADRDAAAAALAEHFAQGRLTLDELNARLDAALAATTHGDLSEALRDLPQQTDHDRAHPAPAGTKPKTSRTHDPSGRLYTVLRSIGRGYRERLGRNLIQATMATA